MSKELTIYLMIDTSSSDENCSGDCDYGPAAAVLLRRSQRQNNHPDASVCSFLHIRQA
jgi:hypothetical protein